MSKEPSSEDMARFTKYGKKEGVDPQLLASIAYQESRYKNTSVSPTKARGMFQFMPNTAKDYGVTDVNQLHDPEISTRIAAKHVAKLQKRYPDDPWKVLAAYNTGPGNVDKYGKGVLGPNWNKRKNAGETGDYVKKITADYARRSDAGQQAAYDKIMQAKHDKKMEKAVKGMAPFVKTSKFLGLRHGLERVKPKAAEEEEPEAESAPRATAKRGDKMASPAVSAAMKLQADRRSAARSDKQKESIAEKLRENKLQGAMNQVMFQARNKNNATFDSRAMATVKKHMTGTKEDFAEFSQAVKGIVLGTQKASGEEERKYWDDKAIQLAKKVAGDIALTIATGAAGKLAQLAHVGMTRAAVGVGKTAAKAAYRVARSPEHGPPRPAPRRLEAGAPPKPRAPLNRQLEAPSASSRLEAPSARYQGPGGKPKPKLLPAHGQKPGEALSNMRDKGMSWKQVSEEAGITQGQARSAVRRFDGTHTSVQKLLGLSEKPSKKLGDFLRGRVKSKAEFKKKYKSLIKELVDLGMPQRARELSGIR